jgi:hypothetical protein
MDRERGRPLTIVTICPAIVSRLCICAHRRPWEADLAGAYSCEFGQCCVFATHIVQHVLVHMHVVHLKLSDARYFARASTWRWMIVTWSEAVLSTRRRRAPSSGTSGWRWCWSSWTSPWCPRDRETFKNRVVLIGFTQLPKETALITYAPVR